MFLGEEYPGGMEEVSRAHVEEKSIHLKIRKPGRDAANVGRSKEHIAEVWSKGLELANIDMADVWFVDSSRTDALLSVYRRFLQGTKTVVFKGLRPQLQA